jgi:hypothetical protein
MSQNGQPQARKLDLVTREVADEVLVYDLKRHKAHCLNQTAALIWKYCDGQKSVGDIAALVGKDVNSTVDEATIWLAVDQLGKANLLEERVIRPAGIPRVTRREAVRRMGLGAALAIPVVMSIVTPTIVNAQSCKANGVACSPTGFNNGNCCSKCCAVNGSTCKTLSAPGASCNNDNDCCSDSCTGPGGSKTCA